MKRELYRQIFEKYLLIKFNENLTSGRRVVPCGQIDERTDGQTGMTKLTVTFRNFANAPKTAAEVVVVVVVVEEEEEVP